MGNKLGGFCRFLTALAVACAVAAGVLIWTGVSSGPVRHYGDKLLCAAPWEAAALSV